MISFLGTYWIWIVFGGVMIVMHMAHGHGHGRGHVGNGHGTGGHAAQGHGCGGQSVADDRNDAAVPDQISARVDKGNDFDNGAPLAATPAQAVAIKDASAGRPAASLQKRPR
jgi:hypothetical protein